MLAQGMLIGLALCLIGIGIGTIMLIYNNSRLIYLNTSVSATTKDEIDKINNNIIISYYIIASCLGIIFVGLIVKSTHIKEHTKGTNYETIACIVLFFIIYMCTIGGITLVISNYMAQPTTNCQLSPPDYSSNSNLKVLNIKTHQIKNIDITYGTLPDKPPILYSNVDNPSSSNINIIKKYATDYITSLKISYYKTKPNGSQSNLLLQTCEFNITNNIDEIVQLLIFLYQIPINITKDSKTLTIPNNFNILI